MPSQSIALTIDWQEIDDRRWNDLLHEIPHSNVIQSAPYAKAYQRLDGMSVRRAIIMIDGQKAGIVQVLEKKHLRGIIHAVMIDRAPLWFDGYGGVAHVKEFFIALNRAFPKRWGRKRRFLPELAHGMTAQKLIEQSGFSHVLPGFSTAWWNIDQSIEILHENLSKSWRSSLDKALKSTLTIEWDDQARQYPWLKKRYSLDKKQRGYFGIAPEYLDDFAIISPSAPSMLIGVAKENDQPCAAVLFLLHGQSATYQIGWSNNIGRKYCAHHLLLWQAVERLKKYGIKQIDLGGISPDEEAKGINFFKLGTGAVRYENIGLYH